MKAAIFKAVPGTDRLYEVSDKGRVRRMGEKAALPYKLVNGHPRVELVIGKKRVRKSICRIVMETFGDPMLAKSYIRHKDGNPLNNRLTNLEYVAETRQKKVTYQENSRPVYEFDATGKLSDLWSSASQISDTYKLNIESIRKACRNHTRCGGTFFSYDALNNVFDRGDTKMESTIGDIIIDRRLESKQSKEVQLLGYNVHPTISREDLILFYEETKRKTTTNGVKNPV